MEEGSSGSFLACIGVVIAVGAGWVRWRGRGGLLVVVIVLRAERDDCAVLEASALAEGGHRWV